MELICKVQNYLWGKKGLKSTVAKLAHENSGIEIDANKCYAELWMGTHPGGPSYLKNKNIPLSQHLINNPVELGLKVIDEFDINLPFLFKVLSINKALSIQAHPSKSHAEQLFKDFPIIYKDGNHKPELAVAVTEFEALCGFRPQQEIKSYLKCIPEFSMLIQQEKMEKFLEAKGDCTDEMKDCFCSFMSSSEKDVAAALDKLLERLEELDEATREAHLSELISRLHSQFPGDIGVFCVYWFNYLCLQPGDAIYLGPNEPHAYISGDCVECMANSDNVVRAGLTSKFRDIETLCKMLTYRSQLPAEIFFKPDIEDEYCQVFRPPVQDFAVAKITVPKKKDYCLTKRTSASIMLVLQGSGNVNEQVHFRPGTILYVPSMDQIQIKTADEDKPVIIYQAFCNV